MPDAETLDTKVLESKVAVALALLEKLVLRLSESRLLPSKF